MRDQKWTILETSLSQCLKCPRCFQSSASAAPDCFPCSQGFCAGGTAARKKTYCFLDKPPRKFPGRFFFIHGELRRALELQVVPDHSTLFRFMLRLEEQVITQALAEVVRDGF
jgi:hypothetical protein